MGYPVHTLQGTPGGLVGPRTDKHGSWASGEDKRKKLNTADAGDRARRFDPSRGFAAVCAAVLPPTLSIILGI